MKRESNRSLEIYLKEIAEYPVLTKEEETNLTRIYHTSKNKEERERAYNTFLKCNLKLVVFIAKKYIKYNLPFEDLISEGNKGLLKAIKKFDEKKGYKFSTYAIPWIKSSITRYISSMKYSLKLSPHAQEELSKKQKEQEKYFVKGEVPPTIKQEPNKSLSNLETLIFGLSHPVELNALSLNRDTEKIHFLEDTRTPKPDKKVIAEERKKLIQEALNILNPKQREIITLHYGLRDGHALNLREIGEEVNLTRERVRQIKEIALKRLKNNPHVKKLLKEYK